jgi:DNA-binding NarL/FixJ family response regulator
MEAIRVIIVDDHKIFRAGLAMMIGEMNRVILVGEAGSGHEFIELIKVTPADIVFMDIQMPEMNGIDATKAAMELFPQLNVIALSMHDEREYLEKMLVTGARGFLLKNAGLDELEKAIHAVKDGNNYFSVELMTLLAQTMGARHRESQERVISFTGREKEVLELTCRGFTTNEIADKLFLSDRTVEKHRASLLEKTGSKNTVNLILFAIRNRLVIL